MSSICLPGPFLSSLHSVAAYFLSMITAYSVFMISFLCEFQILQSLQHMKSSGKEYSMPYFRKPFSSYNCCISLSIMFKLVQAKERWKLLPHPHHGNHRIRKQKHGNQDVLECLGRNPFFISSLLPPSSSFAKLLKRFFLPFKLLIGYQVSL